MSKTTISSGHSYGWHAVHSLREKPFGSKEAAAIAVVNFEEEFGAYFGGWIISGPGMDGKFKVHQGSVAFADLPEVLGGDLPWFVLNGKITRLP